MTKAVPVLFALLLACSLPAMVVVATSPAERSESHHPMTDDPSQPSDRSLVAAVESLHAQDAPTGPNTTSRLSLDGATESGYVERSPDLGTALATGSDELRYEYEAYGVEHGWDDLTHEERSVLLERTYETYRESIEQLWERERTAASEYANGDRSDGELLRELVRIDREARTLVDALRVLESRATEVPGYSLNIENELARLDIHEGQVRSRAYQTIRGGDTVHLSNVVLLSGADSGTVLSTIEDDIYLREATAFDNRDENAPIHYDDREGVIERADEQYPWIDFTEDPSGSSIREYWNIQLFRFVMPHDQGELRTYLDIGTGEVFRETQELFVEGLPKEPLEETWEADGLELSLVETPLNGPMEVTATDVDAGGTLDAAVLVETGGAEYHVADTGTDGSVWILPPSGQYELTLEADDRSVTAQRTG